GDAAVVEPGADGREFGAGDVSVGVEQAGVAAVDDAQPGHGGDGRVGPVVLVHIREGVGRGEIVVPHILVQQAEEDGGHLGPGDIGVGPHRAVRIALDVGVVVVAVQHAGHGGLRPAGEQRHGGGHPQSLILVHPYGQAAVLVPTGKTVAGPGGDVGAVLLIIVHIEGE
ncbi:Transcription elongation factor GreA, partial [Dysosmobacter welbionis]